MPATYGADLFTIGKNRGRREILLKVLINKGKIEKGFADGVRVYNKYPAVLLFTNRGLAREILAAIHLINYLNILSDHSDQLATYLDEKVFLLSFDSTEQWVELLINIPRKTQQKAT